MDKSYNTLLHSISYDGEGNQPDTPQIPCLRASALKGHGNVGCHSSLLSETCCAGMLVAIYASIPSCDITHLGFFFFEFIVLFLFRWGGPKILLKKEKRDLFFSLIKI